MLPSCSGWAMGQTPIPLHNVADSTHFATACQCQVSESENVAFQIPVAQSNAKRRTDLFGPPLL
jgi:hypothetical protein